MRKENAHGQEYHSGGKIKAQLAKFSGIISKGLPRVKRRLIKEILYGIQATKDVKFSNISRSLNEHQRLIKTEHLLEVSTCDFPLALALKQDLHLLIREASMKLVHEFLLSCEKEEFTP